jgi:hypothetical protein
MAQSIQLVSSCHFKPVTVNPYSSMSDHEFGYCSHCGKEAKNAIMWPVFRLGAKTELALRRYREGEVDYNFASGQVSDEAQDQLRSLLEKLQNQFDDGKPDAWYLEPGVAEWQEQKEVSNDT